MAALRTAFPLVAALAFGLAGCYTHHPYGSYGYGPWTPAYSTSPATLAPGTVISPGVESLGSPSTSPGGTYQAPIYQQPSSSNNGGDFYTPDEQQSRKLVPEYEDPNGPGTSNTTYGSGNTTPFGR